MPSWGLLDRRRGVRHILVTVLSGLSDRVWVATWNTVSHLHVGVARCDDLGSGRHDRPVALRICQPGIEVTDLLRMRRRMSVVRPRSCVLGGWHGRDKPRGITRQGSAFPSMVIASMVMASWNGCPIVGGI